MYNKIVGNLGNVMATVKQGKMIDTIGDICKSGRIILKGGNVIDPKNNVRIFLMLLLKMV